MGSVLIFPSTVANASNKLNIYFFWGDGCPHCAKEKVFLTKILPDYPTVSLNQYEVYYNSDNAELMQKVANKIGVDAGGIPFLVIGDQEFVGYGEGTTDKEIESRIKYCLNNNCPDSVNSIVNPSEKKDTKTDKTSKPISSQKKIIKLPIIGEINALSFSLPLLTVFMGVLDGFNPCAMWTLLFLISLLLGLNNRRRMWVLGVAFIIASAFVYFLFMSAWLNLILFLGFIVWVRALIGVLATIGGGYNLKSYLDERKTNGGCKVASGEKRQLVFAKMKAIAQQNSLWLALGGIILLAFAVNLVELVCSAGFPAVFTQVLSLSHLSAWQYYAYILLYIFFFMIDDIIIFAIAMFTLKATGISTKYGKWSKLIGGILMIIIGLLLIFKPEWLMFG